MKIIVLGKNGMLGRYVYTYFKNLGYTTIGTTRKDIDVSDVNKIKLIDLFERLNLVKNDVVINCIGVIKPRIDELGILNGIKINSELPHVLENILNPIGVKFIHPTTDCVFDGLDGNYNEDHPHNVTDVYGRTKSLGEPLNSMVIRTSIIGEEINQGRSLIEWVKSNKDKTVNGFINHKWNGITCLEFAKICEQVIKNNIDWIGVRHIFSPKSLNKEELTNLISKIYNLNINVLPFETPINCDRTLITKFENKIIVNNLRIQIKEMFNYHDQLLNNE